MKDLTPAEYMLCLKFKGIYGWTGTQRSTPHHTVVTWRPGTLFLDWAPKVAKAWSAFTASRKLSRVGSITKQMVQFYCQMFRAVSFFSQYVWIMSELVFFFSFRFWFRSVVLGVVTNGRPEMVNDNMAVKAGDIPNYVVFSEHSPYGALKSTHLSCWWDSSKLTWHQSYYLYLGNAFGS